MSDKKTVVIALGYFDSVHKGHRAVIGTAKSLAEEYGCLTAVFSFKKSPKKVLGISNKTVYSTVERKSILKDFGVDEVFYAPVTKKFLSLTADEFLKFLNDKYNVKAYVCGNDYTFGHKGAGNVQALKSFANNHGQKVVVCEDVLLYGKKISTTRIKNLLASGDIRTANALLGRNYTITGKVFQDRKVGQKIGFPTVNIKIDVDKSCLKDGVYAGGVSVKGKSYRALINYGARPTFSLVEKLIEAHIVDFSGCLYGENLTIRFDEYMRDIVKFNDAYELTDRLNKDLQEIRSGKYD